MIADHLLAEVIPLSRHLDPKVPILWEDTFKLAQSPNGYKNFFAFLPSKKLQKKLKKEYSYNLKPVFLT